MSKIKLLLDVVEDVRAVVDSLIPVIKKFKNLAESLLAVADALASTETKAEHIVDPKEPKTLPQEIEVETVPLWEQVRAVLADKSLKWAHCEIRVLSIFKRQSALLRRCALIMQTVPYHNKQPVQSSAKTGRTGHENNLRHR